MAEQTPSLFPDVVPANAGTGELSQGRKRTIRQRLLAAAGINPLMKTKALDDPAKRCGTCVHRVVLGRGDGSYPKCDLTSMSRSVASDCRAWWPACSRWEAK